MGGGVIDRIKELKHKCLDINSARKPELEKEQEKFWRVKDQMWWEAAELFGDGLVSIPNDKKLVKQLCSVKYKVNSNGKIKIESKDEIKDRLGGDSPDRAEACIMGIYTINHIPIIRHDYKRGVKPKRLNNSYGWGQEAIIHA